MVLKGETSPLQHQMKGHMSFSTPEGCLRKPPDLVRQEPVTSIPCVSGRPSKFRRNRLNFAAA
jgi:hypothetical protein